MATGSIRSIEGLLMEVSSTSRLILDSDGMDKPRVELAKLRSGVVNPEEARRRLIIQGFARSEKQFKNNIKLYIDFCSSLNWDPLNISSHSIQCFVTIFRCPTTCRNVIGSIKNMCQLLMVSNNWDSPELRKMMKNIGKITSNSLLTFLSRELN